MRSARPGADTTKPIGDRRYKYNIKHSARSVEYNAAAGSHQSSRPQRTQCALGKVAVRQSALTEGVDRLGAEGVVLLG